MTPPDPGRVDGCSGPGNVIIDELEPEGTPMADAQMTAQMREGRGFIAALDQSGGSTPKALRLYMGGMERIG